MPVTSEKSCADDGPDALATPDIRLTGLSVAFGDQKALDRVDMVVESGRVLGLIGENGAGKSTLIKCLSGFQNPSTGAHLSVGGRSLPFGRPDKIHEAGLRFVHQHLGLIDELSVEEMVGLRCGYPRTRYKTRDRRKLRRMTDEILLAAALSCAPETLLRDCSHAERTALAIAMALHDLPDGGFLVLDEPTAGMPAAQADVLLERISELRAAQIGIMYVSHNLKEVQRIADSILVLRNGRRVAELVAEKTSVSDLAREMTGNTTAPARRPTVREPEAEIGPRAESEVYEIRGLRGAGLNGIDFSVGAGEVIGFIGLDDSGRGELAAALGGATGAWTDYLRIGADTHTGHLDPKSLLKSGLVYVVGNRAHGAAIPEMSLAENLVLPSLGGLRSGPLVSRRRARQTVEWWIEQLDVRPKLPDRPFRLFSGGNQQKIVLGKWLMTRPRVLVLEEPSAGVDIGARVQITATIQEAARRGAAVIMVTSDNSDLIGVADRVATLSEGRIRHWLGPDELQDSTLTLAMNG